MRKHLFIFYAYLFISCVTAVAQPGRIPSASQRIYAEFRRETLHLKDDTSKVLRLLAFARQLESFSPDTALAITKTARELSLKLHYNRGAELSVFEEGVHAENKNDYPLATQYYREAAKIAESNNFYANIYDIYDISLNSYYYLADYPNAMDIAQKGLSLAEHLNDKENLAHFYNQAGFIYQKQEKANESIKYYAKYLAMGHELNNRAMIADAGNGLADGYLLKKNYKTALHYLFQALGIYDKMKEMERLDRSRQIFKPDKLAHTLSQISSVYKHAGNYKRALQYALAVLDMHDKRGEIFNKYDLAGYYINTGDIYGSLKDYKRAGLLLNKGLSLARSILHREDLRDAYEGISKNFANQLHYDSAYYYQALFTRLKDSIINEKVSKEINKLEAERAGKEIVLLNQQQKLKETAAARETLLRNFVIGFVTLIATILILILFMQTGIKQQKLAFEKQLAVQVERQRISGDMHDDIGTGLSTMLIYVNMLKLKLAGGADTQQIDRIAAMGTGLVEQMKEIVWSLNPRNDRLDNLLLFIRQYFVLLFEPLDYKTDIIYPLVIPDVELENELRRNIFLCVKESLNNVIKHAHATSVQLTVQIVRYRLIVQVKDDGKGLAVPPVNTTGNGLKNIRQRMITINGKCHIFNNNGTVVKLEIHLPRYPNR
jgi:signal transduction histidine kinase